MLKFLLSVIVVWVASFFGSIFALWLIAQFFYVPIIFVAVGTAYQILGPETIVRLWVVYAEECRYQDPRAFSCPDPDNAEAQARATVEWVARAIEGNVSHEPPAANQ